MDKKEIIKTLTRNFKTTQSKVIEKTIKDITNVLSMAEAVNLIGECIDDEQYNKSISTECLGESLDYYLERLNIYLEEVKQTIESIQIANILLIKLNKEDKENENKN